VMPGTGGFRKVRWEDARRGKGKRGGLRVISLLSHLGGPQLQVELRVGRFGFSGA